jgi:hypothetical protein
MKRRVRILLYALYLLVLSSLFVPLSHASWTQFARELLIRLLIVVAFAAVTLRVINIGTVEAYRITEPLPQALAREEVSPVELQGTPVVVKPQPPKRRRSFLVFWIVVLTIYCLTQTSWWGHQAWVGRLMEVAVRWAILLACWGFLVLLWLPKPDANQPEPLHVVPPDCPNVDAPSARRSAS